MLNLPLQDIYLQMASPFPGFPGVLRLLEPPDLPAADIDILRKRLLEQTYNKPFLLEDGVTRTLLFNLDYIQSAMRLADPDALDLRYTHKMMAFLLFHTNTKRLLLLGVGGGSLVKYCYRHMPKLDLTAVDFDADVLAFRSAFLIPPDNARFRIVHADAAVFVTDYSCCPASAFDVILVDACNAAGFAPSITQPGFYEAVRKCLAGRGVLVANLVGEVTERRAHLELIRAAFGDNLLLISVEEGCNHVAYAFKEANFEPRWKWISSQAKAMQARYGLDFPLMAARLERNWYRGWEQVIF